MKRPARSIATIRCLVIAEDPELTGHISEFVFFFSRFVRRPADVGSICPSSRYLSRKMVADLRLGPEDVVLELGPGTGSFTREVYALRQRGVSPRYLGIERDLSMHDYLERRFEGLHFVPGDVRDVKAICDDRGFPPATVVICGIPLTLMDGNVLSRLLEDVRDCMEDSGVFRAFSYMHCYPTAAASRLRTRVRESFEGGYDSAAVMRNVPPAMVITGAKACCGVLELEA